LYCAFFFPEYQLWHLAKQQHRHHEHKHNAAIKLKATFAIISIIALNIDFISFSRELCKCEVRLRNRAVLMKRNDDVAGWDFDEKRSK